MSTINVKITDTGWLLTKGDKTISIKDNGDGKLANGDELSSELSGSGFTQQDILLVANELNNPQAKTAKGKAKGNFWDKAQGFIGGFMNGISSLFSLGGLFGFCGGFFGGQDSWAFNGCGGVGFNDMRVWNYGLNSMWSGDIGYTGSTQGAYAALGGMNGLFRNLGGLSDNLNPYKLFENSSDGLNLKVTTKTTGAPEETDENSNNTGENGKKSTTTQTTTETTTTVTEGVNENGNGGQNTIAGAGQNGKPGTENANGSHNGNKAENDSGKANGGKTGTSGSANAATGPKFYTGDESELNNAENGGSGVGNRRSITD